MTFNFDPMLAMWWEDAKYRGDDFRGWWASEKMDGIRGIWDGTGFVGRAGKGYFSAPASLTSILPPGVALDGELWGGRGAFNSASGIVRRHVAEEEAWKPIKFTIFDAPSVDGTFEERMERVRQIVAEIGDPRIEVSSQVKVDGESRVLSLLDEMTAAGAEGLMLRRPGSRYQQGRSWNLLKVKKYKDMEAVVVGSQEGGGRHSGRMGALCCKTMSGVDFNVGTGFSDAERDKAAELFPVGTVITVKYFETSAAGVPRFPAFVRVRPPGA